jgi:hypothetical protein
MRTLALNALRILFSPLLIGSVAGALFPLWRYEQECVDAESNHGFRQLMLETLARDIVAYCLVGLVLGVLVDAAIAQWRRR